MHLNVRILLSIGAGFLILVVARAQYQINPQANLQINPSLYQTTSANSGSTRYSGQNAVQNPLLASEARDAVSKSGMLPSELRGAALRVGPMAPAAAAAITPSGTRPLRVANDQAARGSRRALRSHWFHALHRFVGVTHRGDMRIDGRVSGSSRQFRPHGWAASWRTSRGDRVAPIELH